MSARSAFLSEKASDTEGRKLDRTILEWLLEEETPEVRLRTLKEYMKLPDDDEEVSECKKLLLQSKTYERALK